MEVDDGLLVLASQRVCGLLGLQVNIIQEFPQLLQLDVPLLVLLELMRTTWTSLMAASSSVLGGHDRRRTYLALGASFSFLQPFLELNHGDAQVCLLTLDLEGDKARLVC